jgi:hypothetical protein
LWLWLWLWLGLRWLLWLRWLRAILARFVSHVCSGFTGQYQVVRDSDKAREYFVSCCEASRKQEKLSYGTPQSYIPFAQQPALARPDLHLPPICPVISPGQLRPGRGEARAANEAPRSVDMQPWLPAMFWAQQITLPEARALLRACCCTNSVKRMFCYRSAKACWEPWFHNEIWCRCSGCRFCMAGGCRFWHPRSP